MKDFPKTPAELNKRLTRGKFLRDSAMTISGIALLPSIITGCRKEHYNPNPTCEKCIGLEPGDLARGAANLTLLRAWIVDLYPLCIEYEEVVFHALASTPQNGNWTNFIVDIFIDIGIGLASAAAVLSGNPGVIPALAGLSAFLHDWGIGKDKPGSLDAVFADFENGHNKMQFAIEQKLGSLVDATNNYSNLAAAWNDQYEFNGKTYTLSDLANSAFPGLGDEYNKLQEGAFTYFKKSLWNLAIMKCCSYYENWAIEQYLPNTPQALLDYVRNKTYREFKGTYVRFQRFDIDPDTGLMKYEIIFYNLGIGGYAFSDEATNILFMDDTPGHIINPDGLFNRSYVFQQFSITKPTFEGHELVDIHHEGNFYGNDDWTFTGGFFPKLTK